MSLHGVSQDLAFDYDGCLALARRLFALADQVTAAGVSRRELAGVAGQGFAGAYARRFAGMVEGGLADVAAAAQGLRSDASDLAGMWKAAMDEENLRRYARHATEVRARRDVFTRAWDDLFGEHLPPAPDPVAVPQPPGFLPTAELVHYAAPPPAPHPVAVR